MNSSITLDEVIASSEKNNGNVLSWHPKDFRDLKKINKKAKFDVTWVNLKFVTVSGKKVSCRIKLSNPIIASGATLSLALADNRRIGSLVPPSVSQISGGGILDLRSDVVGVARTVFAYAQPGVATTNLGADITLDVSTLTDITGITGATGSVLDLGAAAPGRTLSLTQSVDGVFAGNLQGTTDLVIKVTGMLRYTGAALTLPGVDTPAANTPNSVTVLGGGLGLDVGNLREVNLAVDGPRRARLGVTVASGVDTSYAGVVTGNPGAAELVKLNVPRQAISIQGFGDTKLLVPTDPNTREPQNRRVEIIIR